MKMDAVSYYKTPIKFVLLLISLTFALNVFAAEDFEFNTPTVNAIKQKMQERHAQLADYYARGVIGLTSDGMIGLRDISAVPLAEHYSVNVLIAVENQDRNALYAEIARANGHQEWEGGVRNAFAIRWIQHAQPGWWVQANDGWEQK